MVKFPEAQWCKRGGFLTPVQEGSKVVHLKTGILGVCMSFFASVDINPELMKLCYWLANVRYGEVPGASAGQGLDQTFPQGAFKL